MAFLADKFAQAKFEPRTEKVRVEALAEFFNEGEEPVFVVRGLNASELQKTFDAAAKLTAVDQVVKAIASKKDQIDAIRGALGLNADTPPETAKRIEMVVLGCVEPKLDHAMAVKVAEVAPIEFLTLANKITELTGKGGSRVKR